MNTTVQPPAVTVETMTKSQRSLLLYLEARAVDGWGKVDTDHMNEEDMAQAKAWNECGFIQFGRIAFESIRESARRMSSPSHYIVLSDAAWTEAHKERKARAIRTITAKRDWKFASEV